MSSVGVCSCGSLAGGLLGVGSDRSHRSQELDGIPDCLERQGWAVSGFPQDSDPALVDTDSDGLEDGEELVLQTITTISDALQFYDPVTLADLMSLGGEIPEIDPQTSIALPFSNPRTRNSDGDPIVGPPFATTQFVFDDALEANEGTDAFVVDTDGDQVRDGEEVAVGTDPLRADDSSETSVAACIRSGANLFIEGQAVEVDGRTLEGCERVETHCLETMVLRLEISVGDPRINADICSVRKDETGAITLGDVLAATTGSVEVLSVRLSGDSEIEQYRSGADRTGLALLRVNRPPFGSSPEQTVSTIVSVSEGSRSFNVSAGTLRLDRFDLALIELLPQIFAVSEDAGIDPVSMATIIRHEGGEYLRNSDARELVLLRWATLDLGPLSQDTIGIGQLSATTTLNNYEGPLMNVNGLGGFVPPALQGDVDRYLDAEGRTVPVFGIGDVPERIVLLSTVETALPHVALTIFTQRFFGGNKLGIFDDTTATTNERRRDFLLYGDIDLAGGVLGAGDIPVWRDLDWEIPLSNTLPPTLDPRVNQLSGETLGRYRFFEISEERTDRAVLCFLNTAVCEQ